MNKVYRLVWNKVTQSWQVVSELAKGKIKSSCNKNAIEVDAVSSIQSALAICLIGLSTVCVAAPSGGTVSAGTATISTAGTTTTINQSTARAAIDWSSFSTAANETVNFVQPSSSAITLNRVTGTSASNLRGSINANGQVFIINPNGVLFNQTSQVNASGLVASTLNLSNTDFINGNFNFANPTNNRTVENRGNISTTGTGGVVALIAPTVKHSAGTISANEGSVLLAAGSDVTLNLDNTSLVSYTINRGKAQALIDSAGTIKANGGKVILTAQGINALSRAVVNNTGVIEAKTVNNKRGVIELSSDFRSGTVNVAGTLDASAPTSGNGGLINTTADQVNVADGTVISTQRNNQTNLPPNGSRWQLTARNIDVNSVGGTVSGATLNAALNKGNVSLRSVGPEASQGSIDINDTIAWNANTALTLNAGKDINVNNNVSLTADKAKLSMNFGAGYDYNLNNAAKITISGATPTLLINGTAYTVINSLGQAGDLSSNTLQGMKNNLTGNYVLGVDIDASDTVNWNNGAGFDPIGQVVYQPDPNFGPPTEFSGAAFTGQFHGFGHDIQNLSMNTAAALSANGMDYQLSSDGSITSTLTPTGLFSTVRGDLRDIQLSNANIKGGNYTGALVGMHKDGMIKNAHSSGNVMGIMAVGGLVGYAGLREPNFVPTGRIESSSSSANTKGLIAVGGLAGVASNPVYNSSASGNISMPSLAQDSPDQGSTGVLGLAAGGLVGFGSGIYNSHATGNILAGIEINGTVNDQIGFGMAGGLIGLIFGDARNYFIDNSYATGNVTGATLLGGLAGGTLLENGLATEKISIRNSHAHGNVTAASPVLAGNTLGGLIGANSTYHVIESSYATGNVSGNKEVGGFAGANNGIIRNAYSTGSVVGGNQTGGFVGYIDGGLIENSFTNSQVSSLTNYQVGGFVGQNFNGSGTIVNSFWNIDSSGLTQSAGGTGKTTQELKQMNTFTGWDIASINDANSTSLWVIDENSSTPTLRYNP